MSGCKCEPERRKVFLRPDEIKQATRALRFYAEHHPEERNTSRGLAMTLEIIDESYEATYSDDGVPF
jgi:hypothetical protein